MENYFDMEAQGSEYSFGLDWGTFRSSMACISRDEKQEAFFPSYSGVCRGGIPSLFSRDEKGTERVGKEVAANNDLINNPLSVCTSLKTKLSEKKITLSGYAYTPREIAVQIVRQVISESQVLFQQNLIMEDITSLVVGVPVSFSAGEKGEIKSIVQEALGGGQVQLIPEPVLGALAINHQLRRARQDTEHPYLICDFGAGTYDTTVVLPNPHPDAENPAPYVAPYSNGSNKAGDLLDCKMAELIIEKLRFDTEPIDVAVLEQEDHIDHRRLFTVTAREAKEHLTDADTTSVFVSGTSCGSSSVIVTREEFENRIRDVIREDVALAKDVVEQAGLWGNQELEIVMIGGGSNIPLVRAELLNTFEWLNERRIHRRIVDQAVALGAAVFGAMPPLVRPTVSFGYGVDIFHNMANKNMLQVCIPSDANLPMTVKNTYYTREEGQKQVILNIYEIEHGEENAYLELTEGKHKYSITHSFGKAVPQHTKVELTMTLCPSGEMELEVSDGGYSQPTCEVLTVNNTCQ